jgi:hypothetical protein
MYSAVLRYQSQHRQILGMRGLALPQALTGMYLFRVWDFLHLYLSSVSVTAKGTDHHRTHQIQAIGFPAVELPGISQDQQICPLRLRSLKEGTMSAAACSSLVSGTIRGKGAAIVPTLVSGTGSATSWRIGPYHSPRCTIAIRSFSTSV